MIRTSRTVTVLAALALPLGVATAVHAQPPAATAAAKQSRPAAASNVKMTRADGPAGFSIILVLGEMQASGGQNDVPAAAQKALADMKDFLPYKGYRLLDAQWTLCCGRTPLVTLLRGPDSTEYALELSATPVAGDAVNVRFELADSVAAARTEEAVAAARASAEADLGTLRARRETTAQKLGASHPDVRALDEMIRRREREIEATQRVTLRNGVPFRGSFRRRLIDASFRMDIGETVVVGTSRVQGDKALIALLTAVPQRKSEAR